MAVLDKHGFDGIYNDWGYDGLDMVQKNDVGISELFYDPEIEDLLSLIYGEVKRRGGVYKLHADFNNAPNCLDRVYDYLWIGEGVKEDEIGIGKSYRPYIVPCWHMSYKKAYDPDVYYASVIPFMQFPLLKTGRPIRGAGIRENIEYYYGDDDSEYAFMKKIEKYMSEHPQGPYVYSLWSSIPDDEKEYDRWSRYMTLYKPMVKEGSVAYIELRECDDILTNISKDWGC